MGGAGGGAGGGGRGYKLSEMVDCLVVLLFCQVGRVSVLKKTFLTIITFESFAIISSGLSILFCLFSSFLNKLLLLDLNPLGLIW